MRPCARKGMSEIGNSIHAVTVPGALEAWEAILKAHGRFGLDRALAAGDQICRRRFPGGRARRLGLERYVGKLKADAGAAKHYLFNGSAPKEGDVIRFPALGRNAENHRRQGRARVL